MASKQTTKALTLLNSVKTVIEQPRFYPEKVESFKTKCGRLYPTKYNTKEDIYIKHLEKCKTCAVILGLSKRKTGFTQDEVAILWAHGFECQSSTGNYVSSRAYRNHLEHIIRLYHYDVVNTIKTNDGLIITNNQDWARGFSYLTYPRNSDLSLPLTTIRNDINPQIEDIKILDRKEDKVLISYLGHLYLYGRDENQNFLTELHNEGQQTVEDAINSLKPDRVIQAEDRGLEVKRQGDLFFIPLNVPKEEIEITERVKKEEFKTHFRYDNTVSRRTCLIFPEIDNTRHTATKIGYWTLKGKQFNNNQIVVKGTVRHPEHKMLKLGDQWHLVRINRALRNIVIRGARGGFD